MCGRRWGEKENGPNPTDRGKPGVKDHVLVDGRGVPLSVVVTRANVNEHMALPDLLANHVMVRPQPRRTAPQHLCLDAAFDNQPARQIVCREYYVAHIAPKAGRPDDAPLHPGGQARRWVVERTHAWLDRFRRLVVNWEKTTESRYAFLCLACALIAYRA
jgi:transposase